MDQSCEVSTSMDISDNNQVSEENATPKRYYPIRSGFEVPSELPSTSAENSSHQISDAIVLEEKARRQNMKYQADEVTFLARIDPERLPVEVRGTSLATIASTVRELFETIIHETSRSLAPTDLMRICIRAEGLDKPISTYLLPRRDLTVEKVFSAVIKVLQSKDTIQLDSGFMTDVITLHRPVGAGLTNRKVINISVDRLRKQSVLAIPYDDEGLCCAKAIVYARAHLDNNTKDINALRDKRRPALLERAHQLHHSAGVPKGPCTYAEVAKFEEYLDIQIVVFSSEELNHVAYKGRDRPRRINIWLHDGHYDVIKSLKGFYASNGYCENCEKPFDHVDRHRCPDACYICRRRDCIPGIQMRCADCDSLCRSEECFNFHKAVTGNQQQSLCDREYQCRSCCKRIRRSDCPKEMHQCGTLKCPSCGKFVVPAEHQCYLQPVTPQKPNQKIIFFDFETDQASGEHVVNFAVAQYADGREKIFRGYTACEEFCAWLFSPQHKGYTAIAHNMKGFDGQFILAWLLSQGTEPEVIPNGSKVMSIKHTTLRIKIIDSLNFFPMPLSKLPGCFGLSELKKGFFPHLFNTVENQNYVGPLPAAKFYCPDNMSVSARASFFEWYDTHREEEFNFQSEMESYCRSDVDILRRCCMEFRKSLMEISDVDPFCYITIASCCMAVYRATHMPENTIAMVPTHGYVNSTNYSPDAIRWMDFVASIEGIPIQHALNGLGEKKIGGISVDGFCEETKTAYQFHGCFFHGCKQCFERDTIHPLKGVSMASIYRKTKETSEKLQRMGLTVVEMWEHDFAKQKRTDEELKHFLKSHHVQDRLIPREAFFGGRTNAVKLYHEGPTKYVDFTSLYPWVNKYCTYPIGHPKIITEDFDDINQYFGFVHCKVLPPRGLYLPVLPYRREKLLFPLCRTCADTQNQTACTHSDDDRAFIGTWVTEEVKLAISKGYKVIKMYEVYHFERSSDSLFRSYIDHFLKIKQESSGWPADCDTDELKAEYIRQYKAREGIALDPSKIEKNPGRRQVAKLFLNSLWGRFGMNCNRTQLTYVNTLAGFNKTLSDPTKIVKDMYLPTPEVAALQWVTKSEFAPQDVSTNIFIATFTTAWARMKLYSEMDKLDRAVLYHDTDSIIYASDGVSDPPCGNFLGEFTDELNGGLITTFVSGGPKNYAYETADGKTTCKVRGFTLNFKNAEKLNFESMKSMVCSLDTERRISLHNPSKITRDPKRMKVINKEETKVYRVVYDKRVIQPDFTKLPYGY